MTKRKKGFERLRGIAIASTMSLGTLGGIGSARAASTTVGRVILKMTGASLINSNSSTPTNRPNEWKAQGKATYAVDSGAIWVGVGAPASGSAFILSEASLARSGASINTFWSKGGITSSVTTWRKASGSATQNAVNSGLDDAFDGVLALQVDGASFSNPSGSIDLTDTTKGTTITSGLAVDIIPGVDAQIQYFLNDPFSDTIRHHVVAAIYSLTNTTGTLISDSVTISGEMGSDSRTEIQDSGSGDTVNDDADKWFISSDAGAGLFTDLPFNDPVITTTRYGNGALVIPTNSIVMESGKDSYAHNYNVEINPGETVRLLVFHELSWTVSEASAGAATFESITAANAAGFLPELTNEELDSIINYGFDTDGDGTPNRTDNDDDGDGTADSIDVFPYDASEDTDGDGTGDNADGAPNDAGSIVAPSSGGGGAIGLGSILLGLLGLRRRSLRSKK